jgi:siroheme synthase-like protein
MSGLGKGAARFLPMGLDLRGRKCIVVGGGIVASRKVATLVGAGARVTVVSPGVTEDLEKLARGESIVWIEDAFREEYLEGAFLIVAATDDDAVNAAVSRLGSRGHALVCDASSAERSQVIFGALLRRDDTTVAVFTDGKSPTKARRVRDEIAGHISPTDYEDE